jgi:hypothetical protein
MLDFLLSAFTLIAVIVLPMAALLFGVRAFSWGLRHHPNIAAALIVLGIVLVIAAGLSFPRLFPNCRITLGLGHTICKPKPAHLALRSRLGENWHEFRLTPP